MKLKVVFKIFKRKARRHAIGGRRCEISIATILLIARRSVCCPKREIRCYDVPYSNSGDSRRSWNYIKIRMTRNVRIRI
ncbi:hypothetical protein P3L10_001632 [Capsicum annuum]